MTGRRPTPGGSWAWPTLVVLAFATAPPATAADPATPPTAIDPSQRLDQLEIRRDRGRPMVRRGDRWLTADQFLAAVEAATPPAPPAHADPADPLPGESWLPLHSPAALAWVGLGLLGQVLFTGRMLVQWWTSERHRRSVVPPIFWWMSLAGATMLLAYFLWRRDVVGVLGQGVGWVVYARNLWLIHRPPDGVTPAPTAPPTAPPARHEGRPA